MSTLGQRLRKSREAMGWSQTIVCKKLGISNSTLSGYERDYREPDADMIATFAKLYEVSTDFLITGKDTETSDWDSKLPDLTEKDERDLAKDLEKMINNLESGEGYSQFGGQSIEDMDEEDKELIIASLENSMRLAKRMAKQKFTPKKYRK